MSKKNIKRAFGSILMALVLVLLLSNNTFAITCGGVETSLIECPEGGDGGIYHILALIIDIMGIGIGILGVIGISWAGVEYITAGGSEEKTIKAKRRIYEIVLGLVCYAAIVGLSQWLLPGGILNPSNDNSGVSSISLNVSDSPEVGKAFVPTVSLNADAKDKTYSIASSDDSIAVALGQKVKCIDEGIVTITAIAANGTKTSTNIDCVVPIDSGDSGSSGSTGSSGTTETVGSTENTAINGKPNMRSGTKNIIKDRKKEFYSTGDNSYKKVVLGKDSKYGSYKNYVKSLGGVFAQFANTNRIPVKTAADLQAAAEYVWGLLEIWGEDYTTGGYFNEWGSKNLSSDSGTDDGFYAKESYSKRRSRPYGKTASINAFLSKSASSSINTNCHKTIDIFRKSTNLKNIKGGVGSGNDGAHIAMSKVGKIGKVSNLRVGDLITFHHGAIGHTAIVGEVYSDTIVLYDGGSRFQQHRKYKYAVPRTNNHQLGGTYSFYSTWFGWRPWNIDQSVTLKGIN